MIKMSLQQARKKANASGTIKFFMTTESEIEDMHYQLEWIRIIIQGTEEQELDEYNDTLKMYEPMKKIFVKNIDSDEETKRNMKRFFKTKVLDMTQVKEAYRAGYGTACDSNLSNKMLEMGIITHVEWVKDFDQRAIDLDSKC